MSRPRNPAVDTVGIDMYVFSAELWQYDGPSAYLSSVPGILESRRGTTPSQRSVSTVVLQDVRFSASEPSVSTAVMKGVRLSASQPVPRTFD